MFKLTDTLEAKIREDFEEYNFQDDLETYLSDLEDPEFHSYLKSSGEEREKWDRAFELCNQVGERSDFYTSWGEAIGPDQELHWTACMTNGLEVVIDCFEELERSEEEIQEAKELLRYFYSI